MPFYILVVLYIEQAEKSIWRQGDTSVARIFSNLVGMWTGPEDLLGSKSFS